MKNKFWLCKTKKRKKLLKVTILINHSLKVNLNPKQKLVVVKDKTKMPKRKRKATMEKIKMVRRKIKTKKAPKLKMIKEMSRTRKKRSKRKS